MSDRGIRIYKRTFLDKKCPKRKRDVALKQKRRGTGVQPEPRADIASGLLV